MNFQYKVVALVLFFFVGIHISAIAQQRDVKQYNAKNGVNQSNIGNGVIQNGTNVKGDNIIVTTPKGDVVFTKVYNTTNTYQWKLSNEERTKLSEEIINGVMSVLLGYIGNMGNDIQEIKSIISEQQNKEMQENDYQKMLLINKLDSLENRMLNMQTINLLLQDKIERIRHDKATWQYAILPGVRQYKLGHNTNAYVYWGVCLVALGSKGLSLKYDHDYEAYNRRIAGTNNPDEQDYYFEKRDNARQKRDDWNTAFKWIGGGALVINIIDALFITNKSKSFDLSPVIGDKYNGVSITYHF